ncbi:hypothetical protein BH09ACT10_BH09ACT10_13320 [soil metagenome]
MTTHQLEIGGMTCTSCATRVENSLNKLDGVHATVNYATEKAIVETDGSLDVEALIHTVEGTGYTAHVPPEPGAQHGDHDMEAHAGHHDPSVLLLRLKVSAALTLPVLLMSMIPALQFDNWQWLALTLASPVVVWGALPFHRAAWLNARHRAVTMDTLISIGVGAAYLWSLWALFFGGAGMTGMTMTFTWFSQGSGAHEIYLETASVVTVFILAGHYLEANAKHRSSATLRALMDLGAKDVALVRDGREVRLPLDQVAIGDQFIVRPGEKIATDGVVVEGQLGR